MSNKLSFEKSIKRAAHEAGLTAEEKTAMRGALLLAMEPEHQNRQFIFIPIYLALVLFVVGVGTSSVWAAESSLPGDLLYPLKRLSESARLSLSLGAEAKAERESEIAVKRLEEIEKLQGQDKLDPATVVSAEHDFAAHSESIRAAIASMQVSGQLPAAIKINKNFLSKIKTHEAILRAQLASEQAGQNKLDSLVATIKSEGNILSEAEKVSPQSAETSKDVTGDSPLVLPIPPRVPKIKAEPDVKLDEPAPQLPAPPVHKIIPKTQTPTIDNSLGGVMM